LIPNISIAPLQVHYHSEMSSIASFRATQIDYIFITSIHCR